MQSPYDEEGTYSEPLGLRETPLQDTSAVVINSTNSAPDLVRVYAPPTRSTPIGAQRFLESLYGRLDGVVEIM